MNDDHLDSMLKSCFADKFTMDKNVKTQLHRKLYEKQERRNNLLLCVIQIAMLALTLSIGIVAFILIQRNALLVFMLCYVMLGGFIGAVVALIHSKKNMITGRANL